jgi:glycerol-3-phosphate acyltransferase PlsY
MAKVFKISSLAALIATLLAPIYIWLVIGPGLPLIMTAGIMTLILFWRHRANIEKLLSGQESKIGRKSP